MNKDNAMILDPACGGKMFYFDKNDTRVLFADIRKLETELCDGRKFEVKPDIQIDFTKMPFENNRFNLVIFDPPHLTRNTGGNKSKFNTMYGTLNNKEMLPTGYQQIKYGALYQNWREMLSLGFKECFRVLKSGGGTYIQMERDRHQSFRGSQANGRKTNLWKSLWKSIKDSLARLHERVGEFDE